MGRISMVEYEQARQEIKEKFDYEVEHNGRITNMKKTLLHSLPAYKALMEWYPLRDEVEKIIGKRAAIFYCYAISTKNNCLICSTFFEKILKDLNIKFENFAFTGTEQLLIDYGVALVKNPTNISNEIFDKLKKQFSEEEIVLITAFGSIMIATNLINNALDVDLDEYLFDYVREVKK
jgi:tetrahydromethanopterin S-methyltransferase subunit B